jgi:NTE family protein
MDTKKVNLALQGGGAHGAFTWGILDKLLEDGRLIIDGISATSAGAMNAVALTYGMIRDGNEGARETLEELWQTMSQYGQVFSPVRESPFDAFLNLGTEHSLSYLNFDLLTRIFSPYQFNPLNFNPMHNVLNKIIDFEQIRTHHAVKLFICATNVCTGKIKIFQGDEINADTILASAALPHLFQAVEVNGEHYWDGGYMGNPAIFPLIYNTDTSDVVIAHVNPIIRHSLPKTTGDIVNRINEISFNSSLMREIRVISFVTKLLEKNWIKEEYQTEVRKIYMHSIRADSIMEQYMVASKLNPDWQFLTRLRDLGRESAANWLKQCFSQLGKHSTLDFEEFL